MRRSVSSVHLRFLPLSWFVLSFFVNAFVSSTYSRHHHGGAAPLLSLKPSGPGGGRTVSPFGSFLSMALPSISASFTFNSPGESGSPEPAHQEVRRRSLSLGRERAASSVVWSRDSEIPSLLQSQQEPQRQRKRHQQKQRRLGRLQRLRKAISRMGVATKEKIKRLWRRLQHEASRAKGAARKAAVALFKRLPRFRRLGNPSTRVESEGASGLAGAGLAAAAAGSGPAEEAPKGAKALKNRGIFTPVSPAVSGTNAAVKEPVQAEAAAPVPEGLGQDEGAEEWHDALTPEQAEEANEEWFDAVSPEEMSVLLGRAREAEETRKTEMPVKEQYLVEAEMLGLTPECIKYFPRMSIGMRKLCSDWRGHCMFWSLFLREGNLGSSLDVMEELALQTGASIQKAEQLKGTETSIEAHLLRMTITLALAVEALAKAVDQSGEHCWFTDAGNLFLKANEKEEKILYSIHPASFFSNPLQFTKPLERLIRTVQADAVRCFPSLLTEIQARRDLQQILESEKQKLEAAVKELGEELTEQQSRDMQQAIDELELLRMRESCSTEQVYLLAAQAKNIQQFVADYLANGHNWWKVQWPFKLQACRRLSRGSSVVPSDVAESCRKYESLVISKGPGDAGSLLLWVWEAGPYRKD